LKQGFEQTDERPIGRGHFQSVKFGRAEPLQFGGLERSRNPSPFAAYENEQEKVAVGARLAGEAGRCQPLHIHIDAKLLAKFANKRRFGAFARFQLAARKFP